MRCFASVQLSKAEISHTPNTGVLFLNVAATVPRACVCTPSLCVCIAVELYALFP